MALFGEGGPLSSPFEGIAKKLEGQFGGRLEKATEATSDLTKELKAHRTALEANTAAMDELKAELRKQRTTKP